MIAPLFAFRDISDPRFHAFTGDPLSPLPLRTPSIVPLPLQTLTSSRHKNPGRS